ncbi:MAG: cytochrome c oxidase subunit 3 [Phycisphaerae bacterium]|nr:cytochrome c oxidase subunit 3 [Phycisphaerae bacterium]
MREFFRTRRVTPFTDSTARFAAGRFGMWLFLLTLTVIFVSTLFAYVIVRLSPVNAAQWPPPDMPPLPSSLVYSTLALVLSSITMQVATVAAQRGESTVGAWMAATLALGFVFLALQGLAWMHAAAANMNFVKHLYAWTFYVLTILHALHVVGGLIPMIVTTRNALRGAYGPQRLSGITLCAMYWHFLDAVWLVLYATLLWGSRR